MAGFNERAATNDSRNSDRCRRYRPLLGNLPQQRIGRECHRNPWSYDYRPEPACSASQSIACINHSKVEDITNQEDFVVIRQVPNPSPAVGKLDRISTSFKYGPPFSQRIISVIAVGKDAKGQRVTSNPFAARVTVTIRPTVKMSVMFSGMTFEEFEASLNRNATNPSDRDWVPRCVHEEGPETDRRRLTDSRASRLRSRSRGMKLRPHPDWPRHTLAFCCAAI